MGTNSDAHTVKITHAQEMFLSWSLDILIYTIVLNLFVQYHEAIIIDSFSISILTAVLLTALLHTIKGIEKDVHHFFEKKGGRFFRAIGLLAVSLILFLGKFAILEIVNLAFGDRVELGHIIEVIFLILAMLIARRFGSWVYMRLGARERIGGSTAALR